MTMATAPKHGQRAARKHASSAMTLRRAGERGHANLGWLDSWHSFSFADYYDPNHMQFGPLRVINEDRVEPAKGFGTHGHRDMEIVSYVLDGAIEHRDNMGNGSVIKPGNVQRMSAGRGVLHSEYNPSATQAAHFLQIWIMPNVTGITPSYEEKHFSDAQKRGRLCLIASPDGAEQSVTIHQNARIFAGLFSGAEHATYTLALGRIGYAHIARGSVSINGVALSAGDAAMIHAPGAIELQHGNEAEVLLFDLPA